MVENCGKMFPPSLKLLIHRDEKSTVNVLMTVKRFGENYWRELLHSWPPQWQIYFITAHIILPAAQEQAVQNVYRLVSKIVFRLPNDSQIQKTDRVKLRGSWLPTHAGRCRRNTQLLRYDLLWGWCQRIFHLAHLKTIPRFCANRNVIDIIICTLRSVESQLILW